MHIRKPSLTFCIIMDLLGSASFAVPIVGEITDIIWAPVSAIVFYLCFGSKRFGAHGAVFAFVEEILPGLDFIPTFTIAWLIRRVQLPKEVLLTKR